MEKAKWSHPYSRRTGSEGAFASDGGKRLSFKFIAFGQNYSSGSSSGQITIVVVSQK